MDQRRNHPGAKQWVIAHSHGGNVGWHAVSRLRAQFKADIPLITLATPFIHARDRKFAIENMIVPAAYVVTFIVLVADARARQAARAVLHLDLSMPAGFLGGLAALCIAGALARSGSCDRRYLKDVLHAPSARSKDLLVVRAAGDEATSVLLVGQFLALLSSSVIAVLVAPICLFAIIGAAICARASGVQGDSLGLRYLFIVPEATTFALFFLYVLSSLTFGFDGPYAAMRVATSTESTPPGTPQVLQLEPFVNVEGSAGLAQLWKPQRIFAHTRLHDDVNVISLIISHIQNTP